MAPAHAYAARSDGDIDAFHDALTARAASPIPTRTGSNSWDGRFGDPGDRDLIPVRLPRLAAIFPDYEDKALIGWCSLARWNPDYRSASMGYCLDDAASGHAYATEVARALLQWAFDTLDLNRVQAETDTRNTRLLASWKSSDSCVKGRCGKTAS